MFQTISLPAPDEGLTHSSAPSCRYFDPLDIGILFLVLTCYDTCRFVEVTFQNNFLSTPLEPNINIITKLQISFDVIGLVIW